eukprot:5618814-Ditylum_brightwellii.AAC.1
MANDPPTDISVVMQQRLTMQESGGVKASILAEGILSAFLENDIMLVDRPEDTDNVDDMMALLYNLPSETDRDCQQSSRNGQNTTCTKPCRGRSPPFSNQTQVSPLSTHHGTIHSPAFLSHCSN